MTLKIMILEDNPAHTQYLKVMVEEWALCKKIPTSILCFADGIDIPQQTYTSMDLFFLDIRTPTLGGMQVAQNIRAAGSKAVIVFTTGHLQYAVEGYKVQAFRFLLKPISAEACAECLNYVKRKKEASSPSMLTVVQKGIQLPLPIPPSII